MKTFNFLRQLAISSQIGLLFCIVAISFWPSEELIQGALYIWAGISVIIFFIGEYKYSWHRDRWN